MSPGSPCRSGTARNSAAWRGCGVRWRRSPSRLPRIPQLWNDASIPRRPDAGAARNLAEPCRKAYFSNQYSPSDRTSLVFLSMSATTLSL